jgi:hypothetical protein
LISIFEGSLDSNKSWVGELKAFYRKQKILQTTVLLLKEFKISFVTLKTASSIAMPFLKPNWFYTSNLLL